MPLFAWRPRRGAASLGFGVGIRGPEFGQVGIRPRAVPREPRPRKNSQHGASYEPLVDTEPVKKGIQLFLRGVCLGTESEVAKLTNAYARAAVPRLSFQAAAHSPCRDTVPRNKRKGNMHRIDRGSKPVGRRRGRRGAARAWLCRRLDRRRLLSDSLSHTPIGGTLPTFMSARNELKF